MTIKKDHFTYRVFWSEEDQEYVGQCVEFPSLSWLDLSPEKALKGIRDVVEDVVKDMIGNNETIPEPIATKKFSGKFMVRIPPDLHKNLAIQAAEAGISLNRLTTSKLSN